MLFTLRHLCVWRGDQTDLGSTCQELGEVHGVIYKFYSFNYLQSGTGQAVAFPLLLVHEI